LRPEIECVWKPNREYRIKAAVNQEPMLCHITYE
jgi:hypothetical protein